VPRLRSFALPLLWLGAALLVAAVVAYAFGVRFTLTPSVPRGFYVQTDDSVDIDRLVTFCPPQDVAAYALERGYLHRGNCPGGVEPLGKYVLAAEGDTVTLTEGGMMVNGRAVPNSAVYTQDMVGRELPHYGFGEHVVGEDSLFLFSGHHPRSFDSRYFGPVPMSSVRGVLRPLWTFD
jgi:conjugative transfer signal peptidase TraF